MFYYDAFDSNQGYSNGYVYTSSFSDHKDVQDLMNYAAFAHFDWRADRKAQHLGRLALHGRPEGRGHLARTGNTAPPGVGMPQYVLIDNGLVTVKSQEWSPKLSFDYQFTDDDDGLHAAVHGLPRRRLRPAARERAAAHVVRSRVHRQLRGRREERTGSIGGCGSTATSTTW